MFCCSRLPHVSHHFSPLCGVGVGLAAAQRQLFHVPVAPPGCGPAPRRIVRFLRCNLPRAVTPGHGTPRCRSGWNGARTPTTPPSSKRYRPLLSAMRYRSYLRAVPYLSGDATRAYRPHPVGHGRGDLLIGKGPKPVAVPIVEERLGMICGVDRWRCVTVAAGSSVPRPQWGRRVSPCGPLRLWRVRSCWWCQPVEDAAQEAVRLSNRQPRPSLRHQLRRRRPNRRPPR